MEQWKSIAGFEGLYEVSNCGNIRALNYRRTGVAGVISLTTDHYGYAKIRLSKNGIRKDFKVHRLVAQAFLDNNKNKPEVNHKDYNRKNNNINNLEWVTKLENIEHQFKGESANKRKKRVIVTPLNGGDSLVFESLKEASLSLGIAYCCISYCVAGKMKSTKGYVVKGV